MGAGTLIKKSKKPLRKALINNLVNLFVKGDDNMDKFCEKHDISFINPLSIDQSNNSCGIREIDCIQDQFDEIFTSINIKLSKEEYELFFKTLENKFMKLIKELDDDNMNNGIFYTVSLNNKSHKSLIKIFDNIANWSTDWAKNPNSGNLIKLWIIKA